MRFGNLKEAYDCVPVGCGGTGVWGVGVTYKGYLVPATEVRAVSASWAQSQACFLCGFVGLPFVSAPVCAVHQQYLNMQSREGKEGVRFGKLEVMHLHVLKACF